MADTALAGRASGQLDKWQREIDAMPTFEGRVDEAKRKFKSRNTPSNKTFSTVRTTLASLCRGELRCQYCEDNQADEVEHIAPKSLYPDRVFRWSNYLYACGRCNRPKNNRFAIIDVAGSIHEVRRSPGSPAVPPPPGRQVLIDPRVENPLDFLRLDLAGPYATFRFGPVPTADVIARARARWTIDVLQLNTPTRARARRSVHDFCASHLAQYAARKGAGADASILGPMRQTIREMRHPTVFEEMQRQVARVPALRTLFAPIPEALLW